MTITIIDSGGTPAKLPTWFGSTNEVVPSVINIASAPGGYVTMLRLVCCPSSPGDIFKVSGFGRVTNDASEPRYNVGVGYHGWLYDVDDGLAVHPWTRVSPYCGDNVTPDRHHMPLMYDFAFQLPATWIEGHRPVVALRADAESTARRAGDQLTVDQAYGQMNVTCWH
jgi:hypothetical protein